MLAFIRNLARAAARLFRPANSAVTATYGARSAALQRISIVVGDITKLPVDVIVNAANSTLLGGGGVDGAIHRAAGRELLEYCRTLGGCEPGDVKSSPGFNLLAKHVIHAVGPDTRVVVDPAEQDRLLESVYRKAMIEARAFSTIAFPAISCGIYGFNPVLAARIAIRTIAEELETSTWQTVQLVAFDEAVANTLRLQMSAQVVEAAQQPISRIVPAIA